MMSSAASSTDQSWLPDVEDALVMEHFQKRPELAK
jgi:hypothetical protein